ncbi:MAP kinase-activating death domain protein-like isoform X4 [Mizuhopecten yessoensis]|uniref:MAP kinase-activating death domain protein-like isoform X4 n=1 Tax=Mizuhopecten yessoensis TaxID=6573 RepID=UPI000B45F5BD|nr:MAP kinase-activating death domain protein-like isoform X4 [Mizuhopecten yessoensis]
MLEHNTKYLCPRLVDYIIVVGSRHPNHNNNVAQTPELLRRYPLEDHHDFPLPPDIIFFCQPEGCISVGPKRMSLRETTSFVFTLTEKDSGLVRYGICVNFFRPIEKKYSEKSKSERFYGGNADGNTLGIGIESDGRQRSPRTSRRLKTAGRVRNNTLTSLCIVSHHPFFSTFRECMFILRKLIDSCHDRSCTKRIGGSRGSSRDTVWGVLTGQGTDNITGLVMHEVKEIETWILRLLSAPVPVPGKTRVEVQVLPKDLQPPLLFALPDHTRFSLIDFPLHLPLELLGVDTCLKVLAAIMLEYKVVMQSRDYNALSMSVMAFVTMLYPMEYMFPVIPLLPTCMSSAEQLLLAPTPYIIGVPASFLPYKNGFKVPDDVWLVDLDSNKMTMGKLEDIPPFPEPEGTMLKNHLRQALASMSMTPQPIKNLDALAQNPDTMKRRESFSSQTGFNPLIYGNDVDSVDVATRVAMIRFFNSANTLGNFTEHTRTLRLYPRPVVAFQMYSFLKSRPARTHFTARLARSQAVEYYAEWSLCPKNVVFLRVQTSVFDPLLIGDKPKWYAHQLQSLEFKVYDDNSSLAAAVTSSMDLISDDNPTDESGSDSDGAESTSSSYSSLSDFVTDMVNSEIDGDTLCFVPENQVLSVDESKVYTPPNKLHLPDTPVTTSDSAFSMQESDLSSSESSSPTYSREVPGSERLSHVLDNGVAQDFFKYDSGNVTPTSRCVVGRSDSVGSANSTPELPKRPSLQPLSRSINSAFEAYEKASLMDKNNLPLGVEGKGAPNGGSQPRPPNVQGLQTRHVSPGFKTIPTDKDNQSDRASTPSSLISTISNELNDMAQSASNTMSELFESDQEASDSDDDREIEQRSDPGSTRSPQSHHQKPTKPFAPLGNRKALVEKSGLVKHATPRKQKDSTKQTSSSDSRGASNSENQQFLKDIVTNVLDGQGVSWLKLGRIRRLMEDENYRNFMVSRLNKNLDKKLNDDTQHLEDASMTKQVFKGMMTLMKAIVHGLEHTYQNHGIGGMASAFMVLEIAHTHYWAKEIIQGTGSSNRSDTSVTPEINSPYGSHESLSSRSEGSPQKSESHSLHEEHMVAALGSHRAGLLPAVGHTCPGWTRAERPVPTHYSDHSTSSNSTGSGSPVLVNGEEFENIEIQSMSLHQGSVDAGHATVITTGRHPLQVDQNQNTAKSNTPNKCDIIITSGTGPSSESVMSSNSEVMHQMVKNKDLFADNGGKRFSVDSENSEASTLMSSSSETVGEDEGQRKKRINHHSIRSTLSDSEMEMSGMVNYTKRTRSPSTFSNKSSLSSGHRYPEGKMLSTSPLPLSPETSRMYLYEGLVTKDRSRLWDQMQFWEDVYLDAVAQERDIIGMDQGPGEMMERYNSLGDSEKKRLEQDEDRLLSTMLYNLASFMVMMRCNKQELRKKVRRLLGKSHIGLVYSQDVHTVLDLAMTMHGNEISLKPMGSRFMQKQSFTVHWGSDNSGDMLFMEVCDDCIILRSVMGAICDRWWYEKLVNMTYCPKTKVLCLWRKHGEKVQLNQFYTKKCRELYFCVKEAMEKAAARNNGKIAGPELGGEFPVQDLKSGQGGLLQVCMEGIGLLLANSKSFIELGRIKKCFTQKGGIFVLEEFDTKNRQVTLHKFKSRMADQICYAVLCVFSYVAAGMDQQQPQTSLFPIQQRKQT